MLQANNAAMLTKMIKWASTAASMVSAPASRVKLEDKSADKMTGSPTLVDDLLPKDSGIAPLVLDMGNIPNPDDVNAGDVW